MTKPKITKRPKPLVELAVQYGCGARTIHAWKKAGAPLDAPQYKMRLWLSLRKSLPEGTRTWLAKTKPPLREMSSVEASDGTVGAASALKRLEQAEADAYRTLETAIGTGDPFEQKLAREGWLKISESLRKYDLAIEAARRDAGELLLKSDVAKWMRRLGYWLNFSWKMSLPGAVGQIRAVDVLPDAYIAARRLCVSNTITSFAAMAVQDVPGWALSALTTDLDSYWEGASDEVKSRTGLLEAAVKAGAEIDSTTKT